MVLSEVCEFLACGNVCLPVRRPEPLSALLCVCLCVRVCSGEMGHRGGGHLAGTAESGGVQRHLHPARHPRLRAAAPGEEGPEGTHTRLLGFLSPPVNLCEPSRSTINSFSLPPLGLLYFF